MSETELPWWAGHNNPWKAAASFQVRRLTYHWSEEPETVLDPGVNFHVLTLQALGAETYFSCEGHPNDFYVMFSSRVDLALQLRACGYYTVALEGNMGRDILKWSLRINRKITEKARQRIHTNAVAAWVSKFWKSRLADPTKMRLTHKGPLWTPETDKLTRSVVTA